MKEKNPNNPTKHPKYNNPKQDKTKPLQAPSTKLESLYTHLTYSPDPSGSQLGFLPTTPGIYAPVLSQDNPLFFTSQSSPATFSPTSTHPASRSPAPGAGLDSSIVSC